MQVDSFSKMLFVHIPRTGGTSIEYVLNNNKPIPIGIVGLDRDSFISLTCIIESR